jgi:hypothetical protein
MYGDMHEQMISTRFGCRVWTIGSIRCGLAKSRIIFAQRAIHLIGGDMEKPKLALSIIGLSIEIRFKRLQELKCAYYIGLHKRFRPINRAVHMAFGCKIYQCIGLILFKKFDTSSPSVISPKAKW